MEARGVGVSAVVGSGHIGLGGRKGDISDGVGRRGGAKRGRGRGIGAGIDNEQVTRTGNTNYQFNTTKG